MHWLSLNPVHTVQWLWHKWQMMCLCGRGLCMARYEWESYSSNIQQQADMFYMGILGNNNNPNRLCIPPSTPPHPSPPRVVTDHSSELSFGSLINDERWALWIPVPQNSPYSWNEVSMLLWLRLEGACIDSSSRMGRASGLQGNVCIVAHNFIGPLQPANWHQGTVR